MNKKHTQLINFILIVVGGAILIYTIAGEEKNKYLQILGLVIIMFGLYRATNFWVETKDDTFDDIEEDIEIEPEYFPFDETENDNEDKSNQEDKK